MSEEKFNKTNKDKQISFAALGLIFGTAIGAGLSMIIRGNAIFAGIGTALGLIVGAIIDSHMRRKI